MFSAADAERGKRFFGVMGRLRPGVDLAAARKRMADLETRLAKQFSDGDSGNTVRLQPLEEAAVEDVQPLLLVLSGVAGFVLLIACANIAGLMLARGTARQREMAIRTALGASRRALIRQTLTESIVLALLGGAAGLVPALWGIDFISSSASESLPNAGLISLNSTTLVFSLFLSIGTGVLFGLAPALQGSKADIHEALKASASRIQGSRQRLRGVLVAGEVAVTFVLLVGAGLMLGSFARLERANPGYDPRQVLTMRVALPDKQYASPEKQVLFFDEALRRMRELPGVRDASAADALPTTDDLHGSGTWFADRPEPRRGDVPIFLRDDVSSGWFQAMKIPLLRGRPFNERDQKNSEPVGIVDAWTAKHYWPGKDPIGQKVKLEKKGPWIEIVGVAGVVQRPAMIQAALGQAGQIYLPFTQESRPAMSFAVRADGNAAALTESLRKIIAGIDPAQPVFQVRTMEAALAANRVPQRLGTLLLGAFGSLALLLTTIGVYGIVAFSVGQRTREIGIRMALGASRRDVLKTVVGQGLTLTLAGVGIGLAGALALTRLMSSLLYGVLPTDPPTFAGVAMILAGAVLLATYLPARRAAALDPNAALRQE